VRRTLGVAPQYGRAAQALQEGGPPAQEQDPKKNQGELMQRRDVRTHFRVELPEHKALIGSGAG
jgi:hypothetical protein